MIWMVLVIVLVPGGFRCFMLFSFFFFNDPATTEIYTLSLHDALPISRFELDRPLRYQIASYLRHAARDRKSTRLNSSHTVISYAVFCLKKKTNPYIRAYLKNKKETMEREEADEILQ